MAGFRDRSLGHIVLPCLFLDAIYVKAHEDPSVVSQAIVTATAVTAKGDREVLRSGGGDSEDGTLWTAFLRSLRFRGLSSVHLVISDGRGDPVRGGDPARDPRRVGRRRTALPGGGLHGAAVTAQ